MQDRDIQTLTLSSTGYPKLLREIHAPPETIHVKGTLLEEDAAAVAIVGTRAASAYGLEQARRLGQELARCGITVVSGLAEGIDAAAHEGALEAGGRTIAVVGHGLSMVYPRQHRELAERIIRSGCLISQFPMEEEPTAWNFPKRNEVISGLSLGVVVVEAPAKSGALITARHAMEQNREVFAVPGPVSDRTRGTHALLKDGAKLVENAADILEELTPQLKERLGQWKASEQDGLRADLTQEQALVFEAVPVGTAAGLDALAGRAAVQPNRLLSVLTELELKGLIQRQPGHGYTRGK